MRAVLPRRDLQLADGLDGIEGPLRVSLSLEADRGGDGTVLGAFEVPGVLRLGVRVHPCGAIELAAGPGQVHSALLLDQVRAVVRPVRGEVLALAGAGATGWTP